MPEITCLGILVADLIARPVEQFPERGRLVLAEEMALHMGGCASNTAVGLARLGISAGVIGKVGDDPLGDFVTATLNREGVDTQGLVRDRKAQTSATMVFVHADGERSFIHCVGANAAITEQDINFDLLKETRLLHVAGSLLMPGFDGEPTAQVLKRAKQMGLITALDTAWDGAGRWMKAVGPCLPFLDYAVPSIEEARMLTGHQRPAEVAQVLLDRGVKTVALKMGENGSYLRTADQEITLPAFDVKALDATGAGDAFAAGFLAGVLKGWDLESTGRLANAVGALCTLGLGTTAGIRSFPETQQFIKETPVKSSRQ